MHEVSDFKSKRTVIETLEPQSAVLISDNRQNSLFYFSWCRQAFKSIVADEIMQLKFTELDSKKVSKFLAERDSVSVKLAGTYENILIGSLNLHKIKKKLVEANLKVHNFQNTIVVNKDLKMVFNGF